jgi:hypothetical protein
VAATRRPDVFDPDFDPSPGLPSRLRDFNPSEHQRLVINPFLAILGLIGLIWLARELAASPMLVLAVLLALPLVMLPYLIQYHCLDCGRTGCYFRGQDHACVSVLARWRERHRSRFPFPTAWAQLVVWGWLLGAAAMLLVITALT